MEIIKYSAIALAIGFGLYGFWKGLVALEIHKRRREEKASWASGDVSICRYGVNADGEITHIRTRVTEEEIAAMAARASEPLEMPDFLLAKPPFKNSASTKCYFWRRPVE